MSPKDGDNQRVSDREISNLIEKYADEHGVPVDVLEEIYAEERAVVGMDRRSSIFKDVDSILKDHVDEQLNMQSSDDE